MIPERIGIPDGERTARPCRCSGALLVLSRAEYLVLKRDGMPFSTGDSDVPFDGKTAVRVFCGRDEDSKIVDGRTYTFGLCRGCSEVERNQRKDLASRQVQR